MSEEMKNYIKLMESAINEQPEAKKESEELEEKDLAMGAVDSVKSYKRYIANNFDEFKKNIKLLYPQDQKQASEVFVKFLKGQELDRGNLEKLHNTLSKKIREVGDPYDEMAGFVDMVMRLHK